MPAPQRKSAVYLRSALHSAVLAAALLVSTRAQATYSLVIADTKTGALGSVGTSCTGSSAVSRILGLAPGFGAVHAQALSNAAGRDRAVSMLQAGATPEAIIAAITAPSFDLLAASRQYGVVTLAGQSAGYTGASNMAYADDRQGRFGDYVSAYQGNILTSAAVLDQLAASLQAGVACDLPDSLMRALEAGADKGQGDSRCTSGGIPADAGFLKVVDREGKTVINIEVTAKSQGGAVVALRTLFDTWRKIHACSARTVDAGVVSDTDAGDVSTSVDAGTTRQDELDAALVDASSMTVRPRADASSTTRARDTGVVDTDGEDLPIDEEPPAARSNDGGCALTATSTGEAGVGSLSVLLGWLTWRRRRPGAAGRSTARPTA